MGKFDTLDSMVLSILDEKKQNHLQGNVVAIHMEFSGIYLYFGCEPDMKNSTIHGIFFHIPLIFNQ